MRLNPDQEEAVLARVEAAGLRLDTLRDDIADHLCCVIESRLGKGTPFEELLQESIHDLAPNGLLEVQHKTIFLLNAKRIKIMKKLMYGTGFIGALSLSVGAIFKLLHYPMAGVLFTFGFVTLLLLFFPMLGIDRYKVAISKNMNERLKIILGITATLMIGLSGIFKIMHLQGANVLLGVGGLVFAFGFLPFLFFTMYKKSIS